LLTKDHKDELHDDNAPSLHCPGSALLGSRPNGCRTSTEIGRWGTKRGVHRWRRAESDRIRTSTLTQTVIHLNRACPVSAPAFGLSFSCCSAIGSGFTCTCDQSLRCPPKSDLSSPVAGVRCQHNRPPHRDRRVSRITKKPYPVKNAAETTG